MPISKRKMESYKRAELIARELRYQLSQHQRSDPSRLADFVCYWMRSTGMIKYDRPALPKSMVQERNRK